MPHLTRSWSWLALLAAVMVAATLGAATPAEATDHRTPPPPQLNWSDCYQNVAQQFADLGVRYECTDINLPLDYDQPDGVTTRVAMVRLPASDQANKLGSILLNPGGPGGSGIEFALFFGPFAQFVWGPEVAQRFDIIGFDPRGVARSSPARCFPNERAIAAIAPPARFPQTLAEVAAFEWTANQVDDACNTDTPRVLPHMSTANVARDMDRIREAVGDEHLNFVGLSYGSYVGQTYANLFPDRVGAVVIDGVLDPVAWANVEAEIPFSTRLRSDEGAKETLEEFFRQCDAAAPGNCALAPNSAARFDAIAQRLQDAPLEIIDPFSGRPFVLTYPIFIGDVLGTLYSPGAYPFLAELLAFTEAFASPAELGMALERVRTASGLAHQSDGSRRANYRNGLEGSLGPLCADTASPSDYGLWFAAGQASDAAFGYFGSVWTWAGFPCGAWTIEDDDAYTGPYDADTAHPVLVIGNLYDPATRYEGAQTARALLPNSALVTVHTPGHTSLGLSPCAGSITGQYLLDPSSGAIFDGAACVEGINWFDFGAGFAADGEFEFDFRTKLMDEIAFRPVADLSR